MFATLKIYLWSTFLPTTLLLQLGIHTLLVEVDLSHAFICISLPYTAMLLPTQLERTLSSELIRFCSVGQSLPGHD